MPDIEYPTVGYGLAVALDEGTGSYNWPVLQESDTGEPVRLTALGEDANIDIELLPKGTGSVVNNAHTEFTTLTVSQSLNVGTVATIPAAPRVFTLFKDQTVSGAGSAMFRLGSILRGSLTGNLEGYYAYVVDEDRVAFSNTDNGMLTNFVGATLRAGWSGGRTLQQTQLYVGNPNLPGSSSAGTAGPTAYHVSGASFAYSYTDAGGVIGAHRGNLFGRNDATRVRTGSGEYWNSTFGSEIDVGVTAGNMVLWKGGIKVVKWSDDAVPGLVVDFAYGVGDQSGASGWRTGFQLGSVEGVWPFRDYSQIMAFFPSSLGGPAVEAATGINLLGITFGRSAFESAGFRVNPTGNVGALALGGVSLQTRSAVLAKTAVVNTITVLEGGLFSGAVTLTCSAPTTSGTTATASVATYEVAAFAQVGSGGSGYALGDTITLTGGTFGTACSGTVSKVFNGAVQGVTITNAGSYSVLPVGASATTTSGAGTGCTLVPWARILTVTVTNAGTNYSEFLPPTVTCAAAVTTARQALFQVTMTPTQVQLQLNNGKINVTGIPTSSAGLSAGDVYSNAGVLTVV